MGDVATLWTKHDEHTARIQDLEIKSEIHGERLDRHTEEFRAMNKDATERHTEINQTLSTYSSDMKEFVKVYHEQQGQLMGATRVGKWGIGVMLTIIGLAIAYLGATS